MCMRNTAEGCILSEQQAALKQEVSTLDERRDKLEKPFATMRSETQDSSTAGRVFYNGVKSSFTRDFTAPTWSTSMFLVIANEPMHRNISNYVLRGNVYAMRMYGRALTDAEAAHNYAVDKARFNLA